MIIDLPSATNFIFAVSSMIAAITGMASLIQNFFLNRKADHNAKISQSNNEAIGAVATQVTAVDVKVDTVAEQTNGHMTTLLAAVAPIDPALATAAAVKLVETAEKAAEQVKVRAAKTAEDLEKKK